MTKVLNDKGEIVLIGLYLRMAPLYGAATSMAVLLVGILLQSGVLPGRGVYEGLRQPVRIATTLAEVRRYGCQTTLRGGRGSDGHGSAD